MHSFAILAVAFLAFSAFAAPEGILYRRSKKAASDQCLAAMKGGQYPALTACATFMLTTVTLKPA
jgi:hypothetical protein